MGLLDFVQFCLYWDQTKSRQLVWCIVYLGETAVMSPSALTIHFNYHWLEIISFINVMLPSVQHFSVMLFLNQWDDASLRISKNALCSQYCSWLLTLFCASLGSGV